MDKKIAGLLGAAAALTAVTSAQAATSTMGLEPAANYRDLLERIPNALALLQTEEGQGRAAPATGDTRLAQHHHHHHHMRRAIRRILHPHHHHHHHHHHD